MLPHVREHQLNLSEKVGWERGTVVPYFDRFRAIRLGLTLTIARFCLLYRSEKLSIIKVHF